MDSRIIVLSMALMSAVMSAHIASAAPSRAPELQVIDLESRQVEFVIPLASAEERIIAQPLIVDADNDGVVEIVVAHIGGDDAQPFVSVYSRFGVFKKKYPLFIPNTLGASLSVVSGNVDTDEETEFVVSFPEGQATRVYIFDHEWKYNTPQKSSFIAFPESVAGARVAIGNVAGDGVEEILVGTTTGVRSQVGIFTAAGKQVGSTIYPFAEQDTQGVTLETIASASRAYADVAIGLASGAETWMKIYTIDAAFTYPVRTEQRVWSREWESGVRFATADLFHDGGEELLVTPYEGHQAEIVAFHPDGTRAAFQSVYVFEELFRGGVYMDVGQLDSDLAFELIVAPNIQRQNGDLTKGEKYVEVDLSEQTTTLWENGYIIQQFLISSGLAPRYTPTGETKINYKKPLINYDGAIFGESYFFGNTPWNLQFRSGGYFFHTAYWHNDFGRPKSHGCINMREPNARFLYDWAPIGTTVIVHE